MMTSPGRPEVDVRWCRRTEDHLAHWVVEQRVWCHGEPVPPVALSADPMPTVVWLGLYGADYR